VFQSGRYIINLFQTLLHPDREELEDAERRDIGNAANALQIGEFQLLQLAYFERHGKDLPTDRINELFHDYMIKGSVPYWAKHYAKQVLRLDDMGRLQYNSEQYHRYDSEKKLENTSKAKRFVILTCFVVLVTLGCITIATINLDGKFSQFPPYLNEEVIPKKQLP